jgi:hypothetical protein
MSLLEVTRTYKRNTYGSSQTLLNLEIIKVKMMFNFEYENIKYRTEACCLDLAISVLLLN